MEKLLTSTWFIHLRWFAFIGQVFVLALAILVFKLTIPWLNILLLLSLIPLTNLFAQIKTSKKFEEKNIIGSYIFFDTLILTAVLSQAGGPTNPFTIFYLLQVVLAALLLNSRWTWALAVLSSFGFASLFFISTEVPEWQHHGAHHGFSLHLHGMLIAYVTAALLAAYFLNKIASELRIKERKLERLKNLEANQQRLATLTTITAGAAHELGTPLGTIALISHELETYLKNANFDKNIIQDVEILKAETARCKKVLQELSEKTGDLLGEKPENFSLLQLLNLAVSPLNIQEKINLDKFENLEVINAPRKALTLAIRALVKNALESSENSQAEVRIHSEYRNNNIIISVTDNGLGISSEQMERLGEPFYSTKGADKGMGLGVYLTKLTAEQLGGSLSYQSQPQNGTTAFLSFPANCRNCEIAA